MAIHNIDVDPEETFGPVAPLIRFSDEEETGLPFEYEKTTPWGESFTRDEIKKNIRSMRVV